MKVLLTGASGFVGQAIVEELNRNNYTLFTVGRKSLNSELPNYTRADVTNFASLERNIPTWQGIECVVHNAGLAHQFKAVDEREFWRVNAEGTANVARVAAILRVRKFVLISSVSVYGKSSDKSFIAEDFDCRPLGAYAESKLTAEKSAAKICLENNIELTVLRLATVYGEGDVGNVLRLLKTIDAGKFFWIGRGENLKSLIYRDDAARAVRLAVEKPLTGVYNVVGQTVSMREIVENLAKALGKSVKNIRLPKIIVLAVANASAFVLPNKKIEALRDTLKKWVTDDKFDGKKFNREFDFQPQIDLREGIAREVDWYKAKEK